MTAFWKKVSGRGAEDSLARRLFHIISLLLLASILVTIVIMELIDYTSLLNSLKASVRNDALILESIFNQKGTEGLSGNVDSTREVRVTLIAKDGHVFYDSEEDPASMENHRNRIEFKEALKNGHGESTRRSETIGKVSYNYALRLSNGNVLRVSGMINSVMQAVLRGLGVTIVFAVVLLLLARYISKYVAKRIVSSINTLDLEHPLDNAVYEEMQPLLNRIDEQNKTIARQVAALDRAGKMRQEFTANVSHELKTPLMSISGYAELIEKHIAREEDIPEFAGRIRSEAARMTTLVGDIIHLTELDEMKAEEQKEKISLTVTAREAFDSLEMSAKQHEVRMIFDGEEAKVMGIRNVLYEMIRNLIDNAIRYNQKGGTVKVTVRNAGRPGEVPGPFVEVSDTGIGIPKEDTERIFERFYRVDKSHSRMTGGTGLGLSIVKHAAMLHRANIKVDSTLGKGTRIRVTFLAVK